MARQVHRHEAELGRQGAELGRPEALITAPAMDEQERSCPRAIPQPLLRAIDGAIHQEVRRPTVSVNRSWA